MNLRDNKKDLLLYEEAKARQISDWLVGMNGSRLYTLLLKARGYEQVFPIGRVQLDPLPFTGVIPNPLSYISCTNFTQTFSGVFNLK